MITSDMQKRVDLSLEILKHIEDRVDDFKPRLPPELHMQRLDNAVRIFCALDVGKAISWTGPR